MTILTENMFWKLKDVKNRMHEAALVSNRVG